MLQRAPGHAHDCRSRRRSTASVPAGCTGLLLLAVYVPVLAETLHLARLGPGPWSLVIVLSFMPVAVAQVGKSILAARS
jgi:hypothetical protein